MRPRPLHRTTLPFTGTLNESTMLTDQKRHRRRVQIAYKDNIVGGVNVTGGKCALMSS